MIHLPETSLNELIDQNPFAVNKDLQMLAFSGPDTGLMVSQIISLILLMMLAKLINR